MPEGEQSVKKTVGDGRSSINTRVYIINVDLYFINSISFNTDIYVGP